MIKTVAQRLLFWMVVWPVSAIVLGIWVRHRQRLPSHGPAILAVNHNSHLDVLVLLSIFPLGVRNLLRPVGAEDYFFRTPLLAWISRNLLSIIPLKRENIARGEDPLAEVCAALKAGEIVILFPEGTRGEPEKMAELKTGIAHLAERYPEIPVVPIFVYGTGKALPRGELILVPFRVDVYVGESMRWQGNRAEFMGELKERFNILSGEAGSRDWN